MKRGLKFSFSFGNTNKQEALDKLSQEHRKAVNYFLKRLFQKKFIREFLKQYQSPLSYCYKQCAKNRLLRYLRFGVAIKERGINPN